MDLHSMRKRRRVVQAAGVATFALIAGWLPSVLATANAATGNSTTPAPAAAISTSLPALPSVPLSVTDGQSAAALFSNAVSLASVGVDSSAVQAAVATTQQILDQDAVTARKMSQAAQNADKQATAARQEASRAAHAYQSLAGALKAAVLFMYISGPISLTVSPAAGNALAYAITYADTALTPNGLLDLRHADLEQERHALAAAEKAQKAADTARATAAKALAAESSARNRLVAELSSISSASAKQVAADHAELAAQAGAELLSATSLQFSPKSPLPAPLSTTNVALAWAFAELGKPYLWGGTGPNSFDCSGLTQYVWRQAGVQIPRVAADQYSWTIPVPLSQLLPGDLVFFGQTDIHHVGIYIGAGLMINAPHTGTVVQVSSIWWSDLAGFGRVHATGTPVPLHPAPTIQQPATPAVVPTAGPVPSQTKPPPGWVPKPGSTTPIDVYAETPPPASGDSTTLPAPTTTVPDTTTTSTDSSSTSTTTLPDESTTTSTTSSTDDTSSTSTTSTSLTTLPTGP
jgi:peptidoglycan DL-endopeptidase CwlO